LDSSNSRFGTRIACAPVGIQKIQEIRKKSEDAETSEKEKTYEYNKEIVVF
jgi:hypothetical protein